MTALYSVVNQVWDRQYGSWVTAPAPPKVLGGDEDVFVAFSRVSARASNGEPVTWIEIRSPSLLLFLRRCLPSTESLFNKPSGIDAQLVYLRSQLIRKLYHKAPEPTTCEAAEALLTFVEGKYRDATMKLQELPSGTIAWSLLWLLIQDGQDVLIKHEGSQDKMAMRVKSWSYGMSEHGRVFIVQGDAFQWNGRRIQAIKLTRKIVEFSELLSIDSLDVQPLSLAWKSRLIDRSVLYLKHAQQLYCSYTGDFVTRTHAAGLKLNGTGRVMIDVQQYRKSVPVLDVWSDKHEDSILSNLNPIWCPETTNHLLPPILHGFSFNQKKWGEFLVEKLTTVAWSEEPFDNLVLAPKYRDTIRSLVEVHSSAQLKSRLIKDTIPGKSEGCIIALYGRPGCGKTLTAEAISEHLRRPLYYLSAGELGTSVVLLEANLKSILDLATVWNAVLLIDEADVYLEKRQSSELERNTLVSIFLRILEYYQGILLLTTNRISSFDEAFLSRFSLTLQFPDLDEAGRKILWSRYIRLAGSDEKDFDLPLLHRPSLNGRAIQQIVRTAQAISISTNVPLNMNHLRIVLEMGGHT